MGGVIQLKTFFIFVSKTRAIKLNNFNSNLRNWPTQKTLRIFCISTIFCKLAPHDKGGQNNQLVVMEKNPRFKLWRFYVWATDFRSRFQGHVIHNKLMCKAQYKTTCKHCIKLRYVKLRLCFSSPTSWPLQIPFWIVLFD